MSYLTDKEVCWWIRELGGPQVEPIQPDYEQLAKMVRKQEPSNFDIQNSKHRKLFDWYAETGKGLLSGLTKEVALEEATGRQLAWQIAKGCNANVTLGNDGMLQLDTGQPWCPLQGGNGFHRLLIDNGVGVFRSGEGYTACDVEKTYLRKQTIHWRGETREVAAARQLIYKWWGHLTMNVPEDM